MSAGPGRLRVAPLSGDRRGSPPATGLYAAALMTPLSLSVLASKLHKLLGAGHAVGPTDLPAVLAADLAFLLLLGGACAAALLLATRRSWPLTAGILHLVVVTCLLISVCDHAFFVSQGELLSGEMLAYAILNIEMIRGVLSSKMGAGVWLALAAALLTPLLPRVVFRIARPERPTESRRDGHGAPRAIRAWAWWGLAVAASLGLTRLEVDEDLAHLKKDAVVTLIGEALREDPDLAGGPAGVARRDPGLELVAGSGARRYNVAFVILESTRAVSTTAYAPELATTPFLARLARRGVRVENAYTVVPHTSKALIPILCGVDPKITTAIHEARPDGIPTPCLAELLAARGWDTAFIQPAEEEFERRRQLVANLGFETFMGKESLPAAGFEEASYFGYEDMSLVQPALAWVDRSERPFFLTVLTLTAHHDYGLPSGFARRRFADDEPLDRYLNALAYTDRVVERLVEGLERRGLLETTLLVVVGDHGEAFGEHGRLEHDNVLYEEGVRVPMILAGAGVDRPGTVLQGLRQTSDLLPTVAEVLGFRLAGGELAGRSLFSADGHEALFFSCWYARHCMALREGDRKTIYHYGRRGPEVFDLAADPLETRNLAAGSDLERQRARRAIARLQAWKRRNNAHYRAYAGPGGDGEEATP